MSGPDSRSRGRCAERFAEVHGAFERILADSDEIGAAVAVMIDDELVVDLAGSGASASDPDAWSGATAVTVFSCTKGALAMCIHLLADEGELSLETAVSSIWPEFASAGKRAITITMLLDHSAGIPGLSEAPTADELRDAGAMAERLAAEPPLWPPGKRHGYHAVTYGWGLGEVIRRVTGMSAGTFFRVRFAERCGSEFWIGTPESAQPMIRPARLAAISRSERFQVALSQGAPIQRAADRSWRALDREFVNEPATWAAELPGSNGIATARGLARLYATVSSVDRATASGFTPASLAKMRRIRWAGAEDAVYFEPFRFSAGFSQANVAFGPEGFGHAGLGGSIGFADPSCGLSLGFVTDRHAGGDRQLERAQAVIDATYRGLGFRHRETDFWI